MISQVIICDYCFSYWKSFITIYYHQFTFQTFSSSQKGCVKQSLCVLPSVHPDVFLEWDHYFFSKFWYGVRNPHGVVPDTAGFFEKKIAPKQAKNKVFRIYWKVEALIFFWIWSIAKVYFICYSHARYGPKCSLPIRFLYF